MPLRPYQIDGLRRLRQSFAKGHKRVVFIAPGGSGKTVCACEVIKRAISKGQKCLFVCDREELVSQCSKALTREGVTHSFVKAGRNYEHNCNVYVSSVQTLARRPHSAPGTTLIIIDECDQGVGKQHLAVLDRFPEAKVIGLTATAIREQGKSLGDVYDDLVEIASPKQLIDMGWLIQPKVFAPATPDLTGIPTIGGDYKTDDLGELMRAPKLLGDAVDQWKKYGQGKRCIAFACTIAQSLDTVKNLQEAGCKAIHLDGTTPKDFREQTLLDLANGDIDMVVNVGLFGRGTDIPSLERLFIWRPTKSLALHLQMCLRLSRLSPETGKTEAWIIDAAGNHHRHGCIQDDRTWSLVSETKKRNVAPESPIRTCPTCFLVCPAASKVCPGCGAEFETKKQKPIKVGDGDLVELTGSFPRVLRATTQHRTRDYACFAAIARMRGYKPKWADMRYQAKYHGFPPKIVKIAAQHVSREIVDEMVREFEKKPPVQERVQQSGIWSESILRKVFGR
jgi:DNA repair protein RadD